MNEVATVVVTYNRKELLRECIEALLKSDAPSDIFIIDNNSTDGTKEYIADIVKENDNVIYKHLKRNVGGAGGFSAGMNYVVKRGYKYVWIMDDDTIVKPDTLSKLLDAAAMLHDNFGFLSSTVAWTNGNDCKMNIQTYNKNINDIQRYYKKNGLWPVRAATFVSLLFTANAIKGVGLPKREYFIWGDDKEYTRRMSKNKNCYNVIDSKVVHKTVGNEGSNITKDDISRIDRYVYAYRNDLATARDEGIGEVAVYSAGFCLNMVRVVLFAKDNKAKRLKAMLAGLKYGLKFAPKVRHVKVSD